MKQARLFTPGPTAVPAEVLEAQSRPLIHHRTGTFKEAFAEVTEGLRTIMKTENPVVVLAASGSGAMEAAVVNITAPGEKVIVTELGKFSERWRDIAAAYGVETVTVEAEWGSPVAPDAVERAFAENPDAVALLTTHSETSTATLQDVEAFARIAHASDALIAVDGITSIGCHDVRTDEWGLDALVGGSQKGVMTPPGLSYISFSERAVKKMEGPRQPSFYFDGIKALKAAAKNDTAFTPAISLVFGLQAALRMMREEGIDTIIERHAANATAVRSAVGAMGLELLSRESPSNATTAVMAEDFAKDITKKMEHEHGVKIAGGQGRLSGRIVRLGHLGYYYPQDMRTLIHAFEQVCGDLGLVATTGPGVTALERSYAGGD
jgi:aspartate aminotransferase-like enzyme